MVLLTEGKGKRETKGKGTNLRLMDPTRVYQQKKDIRNGYFI